MGAHFEWASVNSSPELVHPADLADVADDGNPDGFHGLALEECMIYGTPADLRALAQRITAALDAAEPALPSLPAPADEGGEVEATCPYVWTADDVAAIEAHHAERRAVYEANGEPYYGDQRGVPTVGEACGAELILWDKDPVRRYLYTEGGKWIAGPSSGADDGGGDEEVNCGNMHYWAVPDIDEWQ